MSSFSFFGYKGFYEVIFRSLEFIKWPSRGSRASMDEADGCFHVSTPLGRFSTHQLRIYNFIYNYIIMIPNPMHET